MDVQISISPLAILSRISVGLKSLSTDLTPGSKRVKHSINNENEQEKNKRKAKRNKEKMTLHLFHFIRIPFSFCFFLRILLP